MAATTNREYELVLMLDPEAPEERREEIASEARERIVSQGSLKHDNAWGMRKLAYEILQRTEADYRLFRFETQGGLLEELDHNLRIAEGVLRFRIFKVEPGSPAIVPPAPLASGAPTPPRGPRRGRGPEPAAEASEATPEQTAAPAEPAPAAEAAPEVTEPATTDDATEAEAAPEVTEPATPDVATEAPPATPAAEPTPAEEAPEQADPDPEPAAEQADPDAEPPAEPGSEPETDR